MSYCQGCADREADVSRLTTALAEQERHVGELLQTVSARTSERDQARAAIQVVEQDIERLRAINATQIEQMALDVRQAYKARNALERQLQEARQERKKHVQHIKAFMGPDYGTPPNEEQEDSFLTFAINDLNGSKQSYKVAYLDREAKLEAAERQIAALREFTESVMITFRNYYGQAIPRQAVEDKIAEWLKLKEAALRPAAPGEEPRQ